MKARNKRILWVVIAGCLVFIGAPIVLIGQQFRQESLDRALIQSVKNLDAPAVNLLLSEGASANARDKPYSPVTVRSMLTDLWSMLHGRASPPDPTHYPCALELAYSTARGNGKLTAEDTSLIRVLLDHSARPDVSDKYGTPLLVWATGDNERRIVELLLEHRCDPNVRTTTGEVALTNANPHCARLLLRYGADVNARDSFGRTPIMYNWELETPQILLDHHAEINSRDFEGRTALFLPPYNDGKVEVVQFMLDHGANVAITDAEEKTALEHITAFASNPPIANFKSVAEIIRMLRRAQRYKPTYKARSEKSLRRQPGSFRKSRIIEGPRSRIRNALPLLALVDGLLIEIKSRRIPPA